jgi:hypothetical protein
MKDAWLEVINVKKLIDFSRRMIYHNFDEENNTLSDKDFLEKIDNIKIDDKEMDSLLPFTECKAILKPYLVKVLSKKNDRTYFKIKEDDYDVFLVQLNKRMVSNIVKDLVSRGLVESAFDSDKNDFVFWVKTDEEDSAQ